MYRLGVDLLGKILACLSGDAPQEICENVKEMLWDLYEMAKISPDMEVIIRDVQFTIETPVFAIPDDVWEQVVEDLASEYNLDIETIEQLLETFFERVTQLKGGE